MAAAFELPLTRAFQHDITNNISVVYNGSMKLCDVCVRKDNSPNGGTVIGRSGRYIVVVTWVYPDFSFSVQHYKEILFLRVNERLPGSMYHTSIIMSIPWDSYVLPRDKFWKISTNGRFMAIVMQIPGTIMHRVVLVVDGIFVQEMNRLIVNFNNDFKFHFHQSGTATITASTTNERFVFNMFDNENDNVSVVSENDSVILNYTYEDINEDNYDYEDITEEYLHRHREEAGDYDYSSYINGDDEDVYED